MSTKRVNRNEEIRKTYYAIVNKVNNNAVLTTVRELMSLVGLKLTYTIHHYIKILREEGYISYSETKARTITVNKEKEMRDSDVLG